MKPSCIFSSRPCKNLSVSSNDTLTQNLVIRLTSLWNLEVWVAAWVDWEDPNKSERWAGWVNPLKPAFPDECPVEGVLEIFMFVPIGRKKKEFLFSCIKWPTGFASCLKCCFV